MFSLLFVSGIESNYHLEDQTHQNGVFQEFPA